MWSYRRIMRISWKEMKSNAEVLKMIGLRNTELVSSNWLPIAQRIDYKCALLCFKCIHGVAPHYLRETLNFYKPRRSLRSTEDSFVLETPKTKLKSFGDRAFSSYGPRIWNSLPKRIRDIDKIESFKKQLKHHLFLKTFCEE